MFSDLDRLKVELRCKATSEEDLVYLRVLRWDGAIKLSTKLARPSEAIFGLPLSVVVVFTLGADRFYLTTWLEDETLGVYSLDLSVDLFQLQRRQAYRIRVPESYYSEFHIQMIDGTLTNIKGKLLDFSAGGCRAQVPGAQADLVGQLQGLMVVGKKPILPFKAVIRHQVAAHGQITLGLEFIEMTPIVESKLFALTLELHREFFARWASS